MRARGSGRAADRGVSLVLVAISLVVIMGMAALAIDLGMLLKVRAEAQRGADAAALAGASAFLLGIGTAAETDSAIQRAMRVADTNYMAGSKIDTASEVTVTVLADSFKVRVRVRRASVATWFARVLGLNSFPVGAKAAARVVTAGGARCVKPLAIPDMWQDGGDVNGNRQVDSTSETWIWGGAPQNDYYRRYTPLTFTTPPASPPADTNSAVYDGTGYGSLWRGLIRDYGRQLTLRDDGNASSGGNCLTAQGNKCLQPGWWALWLMQGENTADLPSLITGCRSQPTYVDSLYPTQTGQIGGLAKSIQDVLDSDPGATWDPNGVDPLTQQTGTVTGSTLGNNWRQSPRTWIMGVFDPSTVVTDSKGQIKEVKFNNYALFFFEGCAGPGKKCGGPKSDLVGRFVGFAPGSGPGNSTLTYLLQLVE